MLNHLKPCLVNLISKDSHLVFSIYSIRLLVYPQPDITQKEPSISSFCSAILMILSLGIGSPTSSSAMSFARFPSP